MRCITVIAFLLGLAGCQGYTFNYVGTGQSLEGYSRSTITGNPNVDILFVIDNSKSMQDKQTDLANNANTFISQFANTNLNYHLGIVTTDMFAPTDAGRLRMATADGSAPAKPYWTTLNPNDSNIDQERQTLVADFVATVQSLGIEGNLNEAGLLAPLRALAPSDPAVATANAGFFRSEADLAVVILTDEDDCSFTPSYASTVQAWTDDQSCYINTQVLFTPSQLVSAYADLKGGNLGQVRMAMIAGGLKNADGTLEPRACLYDSTKNVATDQCGCWVMRAEDYFCSSIHQDYDQPCSAMDSCTGQCPSVPNGACDTPLCNSTPARRYTQFYQALSDGRLSQGYGQGLYIDTVCQADYAQTLLNIAHDVVVQNCFTLPSGVSDPNNVDVSIAHGANGSGGSTILPWYDPQNPQAACHDCADCPQGAWQYSAASGVCLACNPTLQAGDTISIGNGLSTPQ